MKIAVTADVHLAEKGQHPERYNALKNILEQLETERIEILIIAGDLFDKGMQNYTEFEDICRQYSNIKFHIIPGNHDPEISSKAIVGSNVTIYTNPEIAELDNIQFLFIPYSKKVNMGEKIAECSDELSKVAGQWVLIGHGDYLGSGTGSNLYEPGTYMPLNRKDIQEFKPAQVILGHIHISSNREKVCYTGSPCGLNINETGRRSFAVYDTTDNSLTCRTIDTDIIYFKKNFLIIPEKDEIQKLTAKIDECINEWNLSPGEISKVQLRITATGYSSDRTAVLETLTEGFNEFSFYKDELPEIEFSEESDNEQLEAIARSACKLIDELDWGYGGDEPEKDEVIEAALRVIYGKGDN